MYDGHAVSLWCKSTHGIVADEPHSTGLIYPRHAFVGR